MGWEKLPQPRGNAVLPDRIRKEKFCGEHVSMRDRSCTDNLLTWNCWSCQTYRSSGSACSMIIRLRDRIQSEVLDFQNRDELPGCICKSASHWAKAVSLQLTVVVPFRVANTLRPYLFKCAAEISVAWFIWLMCVGGLVTPTFSRG